MARGNKKKKSGSASKLAKMTEEERILYMEQQRLAEEEVKKKKEDMLSQYLRDKLSKEEKATNFNLFKLNNQWRTIMREAKSKELKRDIEILSQTFERVVDRKDSVLKSLVKDLDESDEQYRMALRSHLQNVDKLIALQNQRLQKLNAEYAEELECIRVEFDTEEKFMVEQHGRQMNDLQDILIALDQNFLAKENDARTEFQNNKDEIKNRNLEEKQALRVALESKVEILDVELKAAVAHYTETTEERKGHFESLKAKDEKSAREIEMQMRKLQRLNEQIAFVKARMAQLSKEYDEKNRRLKEERERIVSHFQDLKRRMNELRDLQHERLTKMSLESNGALKEVKRLSDKSERLIKLAERCRRLETEEEKVLPFYASSLTKEEEEDVRTALAEEPQEDWAKLMHKYTQMENFWRRFNKVLLDRLALEKERSILSQENQQLRALLKQYLDGISVNDEILTQSNPLFVVNGKANINLANLDPRVRPAPQVKLEAAHIVAHGVTSRILENQ